MDLGCRSCRAWVQNFQKAVSHEVLHRQSSTGKSLHLRARDLSNRLAEALVVEGLGFGSGFRF